MTLKNLFRAPSARMLAERELEEADRSLLAAQAGREYAEAMCTYHEARIARLRSFLAPTGRMPGAGSVRGVADQEAAVRRKNFEAFAARTSDLNTLPSAPTSAKYGAQTQEEQEATIARFQREYNKNATQTSL